MRIRTFRKIVMVLLGCCAFLFISVCATALKPFKVKADLANPSDFYAVNGASVSIYNEPVAGKDPNALRFAFVMSASQFESLCNDSRTGFKPGVSVRAIVVQTAKLGEGVTGNNVTTDMVANATPMATPNIRFEYWSHPEEGYIPGIEDEQSVYYACVYLYNFPKKAYDKEVSTCAYIDNNGSKTYTAVSTRTISYVANEELKTGKHDQNTTTKDTLEGYIPTLEVPEQYSADGRLLYSAGKHSLDLSALGLKEDSTTQVERNRQNLPVTVSGKTVTVTKGADEYLAPEKPNKYGNTKMDGGETEIRLITSGACYKLPLKVYTDVIYTAQDFDGMKNFLEDTNSTVEATNSSVIPFKYLKKIEGYYYLASDIDFAEGFAEGYSSPFDHWAVGGTVFNQWYGWMATFYGNGYSISNLNLRRTSIYDEALHTNWEGITAHASLFGHIGRYGVIKDVSFMNCSLDDELRRSAFLAFKCVGKVSNVFLDIKLPVRDIDPEKDSDKQDGNAAFIGHTNFFTAPGSDIGAETTIENIIINVRQYGTADYVYRPSHLNGGSTSVKQIKGDFLVVGMPENQIIESYSDVNNLEKVHAQPTFTQEDIIETKPMYSLDPDDNTVNFTEVGITTANKYSRVIREKEEEKLVNVKFGFDSNVAKLRKDEVFNADPWVATGADQEVVVYTASRAYKLSITVYSDIIRSAKDFDDMKKFLRETDIEANSQSNMKYATAIFGYYVLGNDIDFATDFADGYDSPFSYINTGYVPTGYTHGWRATFDGLNHTISNLSITKSANANSMWCTSLFGTIAGQNEDGTGRGLVKNVAFINASLGDKSALYHSAFLANTIYGGVENVYIDLAMKPTGNHQGNAALAGIANSQGVEAVGYATKISEVTVVIRGELGKNDYIFKGDKIGLTRNIQGPLVVMGSFAETQIHPLYDSLWEVQEINENVTAYTKASSVPTATNGSATYSKTGGFNVKWNNKNVTGDYVFQLLETPYSLADGTLDFRKLGIQLDSSTTITRNGVPVDYVVGVGQVVTFKNDEVLTVANRLDATKATGEIVTLTIKTAAATYLAPLQVCTDVVYTAREFEALEEFLVKTDIAPAANKPYIDGCYRIQGYYALGADIDFAKEYPNGFESPFNYFRTGYISTAYGLGWSATFDGNGYTMSNITLVKNTSFDEYIQEKIAAGETYEKVVTVNGQQTTETRYYTDFTNDGNWCVSLFGNVDKFGVIKDVAFVNATLKGDLYSSAFFASSFYGQVNNVYLDVNIDTKNTNATSGNMAFVGQADDRGLHPQDFVSVNNVTVVVSGAKSNDYVFKCANSTKEDTIKAIKGRLVVIGVPETNICNRYAVDNAVEVMNGIINKPNDFVYCFKTADDLYKNTTLSSSYQSVLYVKNAEEGTCKVLWENEVVKTLDLSTSSMGLRPTALNPYEAEDLLPTTPLTYETTFTITKEEAQRAIYHYILSTYSKAVRNAIFNLRIEGDTGYPILSVTGDTYNWYQRLFLDLRTGQPVHLAVTIDNTTGNFTWYVNGEEIKDSVERGDEGAIDTETPVSVKMRVGSETDYNENGDRHSYYFHGKIHSIALFSDTRTKDEIIDDYDLWHNGETLPLGADNLLLAYDFTDAREGQVHFNDLSQNNNDCNLLNWQWSKTSKYNPDDYAFSFMVVGDTQYLNECSIMDLADGIVQPGDTYLDRVYDYIVANIDSKNVKHVFGVGDMTQYNSYSEWELVSQNTNKLNGLVSYSVVPGNHDITFSFANRIRDNDSLAYLRPYFKYHLSDDTINTVEYKKANNLDWKYTPIYNYYNNYYGTYNGLESAYAAQLALDNNKALGVTKGFADYSYINTVTDTNYSEKGNQAPNPRTSNTVHFIHATETLKYMVLALEYGPSDDVLEWAKGLIESHPDYNVIITTHGYMWPDGSYIVKGDANAEENGRVPNTGMVPGINGDASNRGDDMWNELVSKYSNITMVLCGHTTANQVIYRQDKGENGNIVTQMLIDPSYVCVENYGQPLYANDPTNERNLLTGMIATYYVSADGKTIDVEWYSPLQDAYFLQEGQFTVEVNAIQSNAQ